MIDTTSIPPFSLEKFGHDRMMSEIAKMLEEYPFLTRNSLGVSILGREIPILRLGNGRREILYVGAHHGMEWVTAQLLCCFAADFCHAHQKKRTPYGISTELLMRVYTLHIIPMLNPDGVEYQIHGLDKENPLYERVLLMNGNSNDFSHWQANARGVDLNHNYDAGFADYKRLEHEQGILSGAPTRYSGEYPESEPEVAALCRYIRFHDRLCGVMTLHTQGEEIYYTSGDTTVRGTPAIAARLSRFTGYKLANAQHLAAYGGLTDWCVRNLSLPSFTLECGKGENPLPSTEAFPIYARLRQALFCFPSLI